MNPGTSFDLTNGWDFTDEEQQRKAWKQIKTEDPMLIIGSPPCTLFSILYNLVLNQNSHDPVWVKKYEAALAVAEKHVAFCCALYRYQLNRGKHFLHEHPWTARSWKLEQMMDLLQDPRVTLVRSDMCRFGMETHVKEVGGETGMVLKPTGFLTSSWCIATELNARCAGNHEHIPLMGGRAAKAAIYPPALCRAICKGLIKQKEYDLKNNLSTTGKMDRQQLSALVTRVRQEDEHVGAAYVKYQKYSASGGIQKPIGGWPEAWVDFVHEEDGGEDLRGVRPKNGVNILNESIQALYTKNGEVIATDDVNDVDLEPELVLEARAVEMSFFKKMGVYTRVKRSEMQKCPGKMISTKWIDTNKGDRDNPNYRSRLVGREFNEGHNDLLYASTPPLEAMRLILSHAATTDDEQPGRRRQVMINDVSRAYFYAKQKRIIYIELPKEDGDAKVDEIGRLELCLYGTRDAAKGWQDRLSEHLVSIGFRRGKAYPSVFVHVGRKIRLLVHGDDYMLSGFEEDLTWFESELAKVFDIKTQRIGGEENCKEEGKVLNRVIRQTQRGWELEADPRHAEMVLDQLEVRTERSLSAPGSDGKDEEDNDDDEPMDAQGARLFRGVAARLNYLAFDRPDLQFSVK